MNLRLEDRIRLNVNRLLYTDDTYKDLYKKDASMSWPGDFVGRYLLALSSLYEALDDKDLKNKVLLALNEIINQRKDYVNAHHFMGKEFNENLIDEQQMSGNSWYIRSLVSYYNITKDKQILAEINDIIDNFLLKVAPHYAHYPSKSQREIGQVSGHLENKPIDGFLLSSDIGCAFILLDGFVDAYSVTLNDKLKIAIENIIDIFKKIDYLALKCQTHATLTCSRAILRFYKLTNKKKYLDFVIKVFNDYQKYGMTIDFQNINWFNKLDSWTEPCCVIDSFILCHDLYLITNKNNYLKLFNKIVTNGLRTFQRDNGGAGCTSIVINKDSILKCFMYEAWFCCSMRLGEGMKYLSMSRFEKIDDYYLMINPEKYSNEFINIDVDYYYNKSIDIKTSKDMKLAIYVPDGLVIKNANTEYTLKDNLIIFNLKQNNKVHIDCDFIISKINDINFYGDMLLTSKEKHDDNIITINGIDYSYLLSSANYKKDELELISQHL